MDASIYCTSYCNKGHNLKTGRPVNHECRILPPSALRAEQAGRVEQARNIIAASRSVVVVGRDARRSSHGSVEH